jgi:hypothetical protein
MASTVNKDFKIKNGLIVEGSSATVGGSDVLTKKQADLDYIVALAGGGAETANVANKVVKRDASGNFAAGTITAALTGNASTASTLATPRAIALSGDVSGTANFDGSAGITITTTLNADFATDAEVATAKSQAISSAATDATTKADAAKSGAEATAASALSTHNSDTTDVHGIADTALLATKSYADGKASDAQTAATTAAASDATSKANAAQAAAEATASADATSKVSAEASARTTAIATAKTAAEGVASADATSKANAALSDANTYTDGKIATEVTDRNSAISSAIATEVTNRNSAISTAVAAVVDSAPAALDTLNELAAALADSPDTVSNLTNLVGTKLPLAGGTLTGALTLSGAPTVDLQAATKKYVDDAATTSVSTASADATSKANAAQSAAEATAATDATNKANAAQSAAATDATTKANAAQSAAATDATSKANAAQSAAESFATSADTAVRTAVTSEIATAKSEAISAAATDASTKRDAAKTYADGLITTEVSARNSAITTAVDALSTSDIEEGTNKYFTDARAIAATAGALTSAINAIDTDAIEEGTSNLYFTNARALTAVGGSVTTAIANGDATASPTYLAVKLGTIAKEFAATVAVPTASTATAFSWAHADFRSAKVLVKIKNGTHTEISELLLTLDTSNNIAITEYALVGTNGTLATVTADVDGANARIRVTTINASSDVFVAGTLIA